MTTDQLHERDVFPRPSHHDIQSTWEKLFSDPLISLTRLKSRSLDKAGLGPAGPDGGVILRSVYWRFYHSLLPPPTSLDLFPQALEASRESYNALRRRYLIAPDGRWASDCSGFDESLSPTSPTHRTSPRIASPVHDSPLQPSDGWDPLSLSTSSPWKTWFAHTELRATIRQDVERTFPDMPYFQLERVQRCMTTALFIFAVLNPDVGYRQGMHELFACCFMAVDRDSLKVVNKADGQQKEAMIKTLDRRYVEHDAFELFLAIMKNAKAFYEWRAEEGPIRSRTATAPQAPIIVRCNNLHTSLLRRIDPQLYERLETEGVEAQIWAIRWIRLIFTRELPFNVAMRLWDGIFAEDPGLQLLDHICIAMLLLVRNELIDADYPSLLTNLLHYPAPSSAYPFEPFLILAQALFLRSDTSPAAGVEIVIQNQDLLDVKAAPKNQEMDVNGPRSHNSRFADGRGNGRTMSGTVKERLQKGGMGGLAQGLFERAQAAGLDKAFISTVNDFRKNLPDSTTAYSYLPNLPFSPSHSPGPRTSSPFSAIPNSASALPSRSFLSHSPSTTNSIPPSRPALQSRSSTDSHASQISVKTIKDAEREMAELRLAMLGMGKAMSEWLDVLNNPEQHLEKSERENAWKGLERVKETLIDAAGKEVDEIVKEWGWHEGLEASSSRSSTPAPSIMVPPLEAPVTEPEPSPATVVAASGPSNIEFEEATPTPLSVAVMPTTPRFLSASRHSVSPASQDNSSATSGGEKRSLTQTVRGDGPISGLPRVPHTAPINSESTKYRPEEAGRPASAGLGIISVDEEEHSKDQLPANVDPLAGLGTKVRNSRRQAGAGVDPLLGMDIQ
ncbi:conserved hypothetical protein [Cryptococcus deneoformans JEC21]|uniref:Rab-GAP TBC domain-containing protein n=1 Tax=Cryptococcus deneoformans (strain JEC21 / ATCC MYA-565) TaxID=214684 RepID=Q5K9F1_CRYD1|nr:conserved hypothetical protein [Cryptococcus neoformans var. neoformans JEC21]AAW46174.2 conserved hypothetical protein [Cryptococcus neoformans var. neoformans JEC21]